MDPLMKSVLVTFALAAGVALAQLLLKYQSRPKPRGSKHRLTLEDCVWWHEWVVTATVGMSILTIKNSNSGNPNGLALTVGWIGAFLIGYVIMPMCIKNLFYNPGGRIKHVGYVILADCFGLIFLMVAVIVGVNLYG